MPCIFFICRGCVVSLFYDEPDQPVENQPQPPSPWSKLTLAGRVLLLAHLVLGIGGSALYICDYLPQLPAGRYPILMFVVPVGLVCVFLFFAIAWALERIGLRIYMREPETRVK